MRTLSLDHPEAERVLRPLLLSPAPAEETEPQDDRVRTAALAYVAGIDTRSLREIARELGTEKSALHKAVTIIRDRVGIRSGSITDRKRDRLREARRRVLERKKALAATNSEGPHKANQTLSSMTPNLSTSGGAA